MSGWRKRTIMEMAREVKMPYDFVTGEPINIEKLEAFAELVRADEREMLAQPAPYMAVLTDRMNVDPHTGYVSIGTVAQPEERNFCPRCGKRTRDLTTIHTCTPPQ